MENAKSFKGVVRDGGVVFEEGVSLPNGTPVLVTVQSAGSPRGVLDAMRQPPQIEDEDVAAMLEEIERGKRPVQFGSPLD